MVVDEITDGYRIAELLASEVDGRRSGPLGELSVVNPDRSVEGTPEGERAYDVRTVAADRDPRREPAPTEVGELFARAFVHEDGASVAVYRGLDAAAEAASGAGLAVRREDGGDESEAPSERVRVLVDRAADVKHAADALAAAREADAGLSADEDADSRGNDPRSVDENG